MKADVNQQRSLLELSELDAQLSRVAHRLKNLPEQAQLTEAQTALRQAGDKLAVVQIALEDIDAQVAKFEHEIDGVRQREDRDRSLMAGGTVDAKQLTELQHELGTLERRQASLEDSLLEVMERREELEAEIARQRQTVDDLQTAHDDAQRTCDDARAELERTREETTGRRDRLAAQIDEALLTLYERQRSRNGVGAGALQGRRCGACRLEIDQGELARIAAADDDDVLRCPECSVILLRVKGYQA
ncbi:zinc ribbon domain-containing protein [Mycobacterium sp. SMC-4]|uniref:zinc ribbon domain-containing protein n=1 Tax=Mycobacterium sp. SMC-4 TaxID=2857059 RepID=UPI003D01585F